MASFPVLMAMAKAVNPRCDARPGACNTIQELGRVHTNPDRYLLPLSSPPPPCIRVQVPHPIFPPKHPRLAL
jgi:hypothetical protein